MGEGCPQKATARTSAPATAARLEVGGRGMQLSRSTHPCPLSTELINRWDRTPRALDPACFHRNKSFRLTIPSGLAQGLAFDAPCCGSAPPGTYLGTPFLSDLCIFRHCGIFRASNTDSNNSLPSPRPIRRHRVRFSNKLD